MQRPVFRCIAAILAVSLFAEPCAFAASEWRPVRLDWNGAAALTRAKKSLSFLPASVARIEAAHEAAGKPLKLFLVHDAHTNPSSQLNVARTLDLLYSNGAQAELGGVFLEAGSGDESLSFLRRPLPRADRGRIAEAYLRRGLLQGVEYADLTQEHPFAMQGVEDMALYKEAVETYRRVAVKRESLLEYLSTLEKSEQTLKPRVLNPALAAFDEKRRAHEAGGLPVTEYFDSLLGYAHEAKIPMGKYPALRVLRSLRAMETALDFRAAGQEEAKALLELPVITRAALVESHAKPEKASSTDNAVRDGFFAALEEELGGDIASRYPNLAAYFRYLRHSRKLEAGAVPSELASLESLVERFLCVNDEEAAFLSVSKNTRLLKKLLTLTMTPDEFTDYSARRREFDIRRLSGFLNRRIMGLREFYEDAVFLDEEFEPAARDAERFYKLTLARDEAFVERALAGLRAAGRRSGVLVTGGYHSPNLRRLLESRGVSYVVLIPQVLHETNRARYEKLLLGQQLSVSAPASAPSWIQLRRTGSDALGTRAEVFGAFGHPAAPGARLAIDPARSYNRDPDGSRLALGGAVRLPYDLERSREIESQIEDGSLEKERGAKRQISEVFSKFDRTVEEENARRVRRGATEKGTLVTVGRHGRASYFLMLLAAAGGYLKSLRRVERVIRKLAATVEGGKTGELANLVARLEGPLGDFVTLLAEGRATHADIEGRRKRLRAGVEDFRTRAHKEIQAAMESKRGQANAKRLRVLRREVDGLARKMDGFLDDLMAALDGSEAEPGNVSVLLQRVSESGVRNLARINLGLDPFEGDEEHITEAIQDAGENVYASPDNVWVKYSDFWIEALPLYIHEEETTLPDGRTVKSIVIEQEAFEAALRQMAPYFAENILMTEDSGYAAIARERLVRLDPKLAALARRVRQARRDWSEEEVALETIRRAVLRDADVMRRVDELAALVAATSRALAWQVSGVMGRSGASRYDALREALDYDVSEGNLVRAAEKKSAGGEGFSEAVHEIFRGAGLTTERFEREGLSAQKRREVPTWIILTTQAAGMSDMFAGFWLDEEMSLYSLASGTVHDGKTLDERADEKLTEYQSRIVAIAEEVIEEFNMGPDLAKEMAKPNTSRRSAVMALVKGYPELAEEVSKIAVLRETGLEAGVAAVIERSGDELRRQAAERVIRENAELQEREDGGYAAVENQEAYRREAAKYVSVLARARVFAEHEMREPLEDYARQYLRLHLGGGANIGLSTARKEVISRYFRHDDGTLEEVDDWGRFWSSGRGAAGAPLMNLLNDPVYAFEAAGAFKRYNRGYGASRVDLGAYERHTVQDLVQWVGAADKHAERAMMRFYRLYNFDPTPMSEVRVAEIAKPGENHALEANLSFAHSMMSLMRAIGVGNYHHLAFQWNDRNLFMRAGGGGSDGYCQPKDIGFLPFVVGASMWMILAYAGVPETARDEVIRLFRKYMLERRRFANEAEWRQYVLEDLREQVPVARLAAGHYLPPILRLARALDQIGVRDFAVDPHGFVNSLAGDYHGRNEGNWEANIRFSAVELVHLIQEVLDRESERSGGRKRGYEDAVIVLPVEYKPVGDVRLSIGLRLLEFMAGAGDYLMEPFNDDARSISRLILYGYDPEDENLAAILRRMLHKETIDEETRRELEETFPRGRVPREVRMVSPFRMTPGSINDYMRDNRLKEVADALRAALREAFGTDDTTLDKNVLTFGTQIERYSFVHRLSGEALSQALGRVQLALAETGIPLKGALSMLALQVRLADPDTVQMSGSDVWSAARGSDVFVLLVHFNEVAGDEDAAAERRDPRILGIDEEELLAQEARERADTVIYNLGRLRDTMREGHPESALLVVDAPTQARKNLFDIRAIKDWLGLNATGRAPLRQTIDELEAGVSPGYASPAVARGEVDLYRAEMAADRRNMHDFFKALERGDDEAARRIYTERVVPLLPERLDQARREEELAKKAADWWRGGGYMNWNRRHRVAAERYLRAFSDRDPAKLDWTTFLVLGGSYLVNGEADEEIAWAKSTFEAGVARLSGTQASRLAEDADLFVTPKYVAPVSNIRQKAGQRTSLKREEDETGVSGKATGRALELYRLEQEAVAARERGEGFRAANGERIPVDDAYRSAKNALGDGRSPLSYAEHGRFLGFAKTVMTGLVEETFVYEGAPSMSEEEKEEMSDMLERLDLLFGSGQSLNEEDWEFVAGFKEDIGDFGRLGRRLQQRFQGEELRARLRRLTMGMELFLIALALESTLEFDHMTDEQYRALGADAVSKRLFETLAKFYAATLYDHYFDYVPKILAPSESGPYATNYNFLYGRNFDPSSGRVLGPGEPFTRDEILEISVGLFSWIDSRVERLLETRSRLSGYSEEDRAQIFGRIGEPGIGTASETDTPEARRWWRITQKRELAYQDHDGHEVAAVIEGDDVVDVLSADHVGEDGRHVLGAKPTIPIVATAGRTHLTTLLEEQANYDVENPGRRVNLVIGREADFRAVRVLRDGVETEETLMTVSSGYKYVSEAEFVELRRRQLERRGVPAAEAIRRAADEARAALKKNPKGVLIAFRSSKPIVSSFSFPMHGAPHYQQGKDEAIGLPTSQSWMHFLLMYDKLTHTVIHGEGSGVTVPPELQWKGKTWQYDRDGYLRPHKDIVREILEGRDGFSGLVSFALLHRALISKAATQSGGRETWAGQVLDAAGAPIAESMEELAEHLEKVGLADNSVIQKMIHSDPRDWASRGYLNELTYALIAKGLSVPWWANLFVYSRIIMMSSRPAAEEEANEYDYVLELIVSSLMAVSNVGLGGVLRKNRPDYYRTAEIYRELSEKRRQTAVRSMRRIVEASADLAARVESQVVQSGTARRVGVSGRKDRTGVSYDYPRYMMHDFLDVPVIEVEGRRLRLPEIVDYKWDPDGELVSLAVLVENENHIAGQPKWRRVDVGPEAIVDWEVVLIENNIGYGLWAPYKLDERAQERRRAAEAGEQPNPFHWGGELRLLLRHFTDAAYDYSATLTDATRPAAPVFDEFSREQAEVGEQAAPAAAADETAVFASAVVESAGNGEQNLFVIYDDERGIANELRPLVASASLERTADGRPRYNVFGVKPEWIDRSGAPGAARRVQYFNAAAQRFVETRLVDTLEPDLVQYKGVVGSGRLTELYRTLRVAQVNPFSPDSASAAARDKFATTRKIEGAVRTPRAFLVRRGSSAEEAAAMAREALDALSGEDDSAVTLRVQANRGTEGEDNFTETLPAETAGTLDASHAFVKRLAGLATSDDVLLRKEVGNVRYGAHQRRVTFRVNVFSDGKVSRADSGYVQVGAPGGDTASAGNGGQILSIPEAILHLREAGSGRPVMFTQAGLEAMKRGAERALDALNKDVSADGILRFAGVDVEAEIGLGGKWSFVILEINPEPEGIVHSRRLERSHAIGSLTPARALFRPEGARLAARTSAAPVPVFQAPDYETFLAETKPERLLQSFSGVRFMEASPAHLLAISIYAYVYAKMLWGNKDADLRIVLSRDPRPSGPAIRAAFIRGLLAAQSESRHKMEIVDLGVVTTPMAFAMTKAYAEAHESVVDGTVVFTGSHNPIEQNGIKITEASNKAGVAVLGAEVMSGLISEFQTIRRDRGEWSKAVKLFSTVRDIRPESVRQAEIDLVRKVYVEHLRNLFLKLNLDSMRGVPVAVNSNAGAGSGHIQWALRSMGMRPRDVNGRRRKPRFQIEPSETSDGIAAMKRFLQENRKYPFGIFFDFDADRGVVVLPDDEMTPELTALLNVFVSLAWTDTHHLADDKEIRVVSHEPTTRALEKIVNKFDRDGRAVRVRRQEVGETNIVAAMRQERGRGRFVPIGVEAANGGNIFMEATSRDGVVTAILMAMALKDPALRERLKQVYPEALGKLGDADWSLSKLIAALPPRFYDLNKTPVSLDAVPAIKRAFERNFERLWAEETELSARLKAIYRGYQFLYFNGASEMYHDFGDGMGGWVLQLDRLDGNEPDFVWLRSSKTEPNMRDRVDAEDAASFELLSRVRAELWALSSAGATGARLAAGVAKRPEEAARVSPLAAVLDETEMQDFKLFAAQLAMKKLPFALLEDDRPFEFRPVFKQNQSMELYWVDEKGDRSLLLTLERDEMRSLIASGRADSAEERAARLQAYLSAYKVASYQAANLYPDETLVGPHELSVAFPVSMLSGFGDSRELALQARNLTRSLQNQTRERYGRNVTFSLYGHLADPAQDRLVRDAAATAGMEMLDEAPLTGVVYEDAESAEALGELDGRLLLPLSRLESRQVGNYTALSRQAIFAGRRHADSAGVLRMEEVASVRDEDTAAYNRLSLSRVDRGILWSIYRGAASRQILRSYRLRSDIPVEPVDFDFLYVLEHLNRQLEQAA